MAMLEIENLSAGYGNVQVLRDVSLSVDEGRIVALLGANGAGKTTLLNAIYGLHKPSSGTVVFRGRRIDDMPGDKIIEQGIAYLPEGGRLFPDMSVKENLEMGAYPRGLWRDRKRDLERVYKLLPRLGERKKQLARTMSGGERQMLAMGRCLMSDPKMCFFDELSYGLAPKMAQEVLGMVKELNAGGLSVLLVEQNVRQTLEVADYAYVMENGVIALEGEGRSLLDNEHVKKAYLGL
ncbi:MAG: ABC transporter ATP-binding protein [Oscillospiraceae bacterium]|nr:ABC transporter ATP-binding protein [Oscillospiraceae bacterium]